MEASVFDRVTRLAFGGSRRDFVRVLFAAATALRMPSIQVAHAQSSGIVALGGVCSTSADCAQIIAPNSNGRIALLVNMAKRAGLPWDAILGAEIARAYKPHPQVYLRCAEVLGLAPVAVMMVAAHNGDLIAAGGCGLQTAFVPRPAEYGPNQTSDLAPEHKVDLIATDFINLANQLGVPPASI